MAAKKFNFNTPLLEQAKNIELRPHQLFLRFYRPLLAKTNSMMFHYVGHRRSGKSTGESVAIQETCVDTYNETGIFKFPNSDVDSSFPKIAYIAETQAQARDIIWQQLCLRMSVFRDIEIKQRELRIFVDRPHIGDHMEIMFRSLRNHNQIRGNKLRHLFVDEAQFMSEDSYAKSVLSTLSDSKGTGITTGTAIPDGYYPELLRRAREEGNPVVIVPASGTQVFSKEQLLQFKLEMGERAFLQEYECDFNVPNKGTFFSEQLYKLERSSGFFNFEYDPSLPLLCGVDIGIAQGMCFWLAQVQGNRLALIDHFDNYEIMQNVRNDFEDAGNEAYGIPYIPDYFYLPHDAKTRTIGARCPHTVKDVVRQIFPESKQIQLKRPGQKMAVITNTAENLHLLGLPPSRVPSDCYGGFQKLKNYGRVINKEGIITDQIDKRFGHDHTADSLMHLFEGLKIKEGKIGEAHKLVKKGESFNQNSLLTIGRVPSRLSYYAVQRALIDRRIHAEEWED